MNLPTYNPKGDPAETINLKFDNYYVVAWQDEFPDSLQNQQVLYRMTDHYPRFDFISLNAFFQISRSTFKDHNKESAQIEKAIQFEFFETKFEFNEKQNQDSKQTKDGSHSQVAQIMEKLTGKEHLAKIDQGQIILSEKDTGKVCTTNIIYITLKKPHHPGIYNRMKNLLVVSAQEVWGGLEPKTEHMSQGKTDKQDNQEEEEKALTKKKHKKKSKKDKEVEEEEEEEVKEEKGETMKNVKKKK